ncbi:MAG TPA: sigma-70 family RNA polymerase sigma factor [Thermoanaerobaculia bacterium]|nr:sigma-70 family RNA polymerase sigma factor [Thermoanaerobaculia bacterium]
MQAVAVGSETREHDRELAELHRLGDRDAFAEVYREHAEAVYNLALRLSGDPFDAADLTQEVFLRVFRHLGGFRGGSSLRTWIYRVALNHCRSRLARRRPPARSLDDPDEPAACELADPSPGPEATALAEDAARRVAAALARLPLVFREAVVLRDLEGLAYEEIADVLGTRVGTVRSRIARGRDRLRREIEKEDVS